MQQDNSRCKLGDFTVGVGGGNKQGTGWVSAGLGVDKVNYCIGCPDWSGAEWGEHRTTMDPTI